MHDQRSQCFHVSRRAFFGAAMGLATIPIIDTGSAALAAGMTWKQLGDGGGPSARWDHTIAYDEGSKQLIVFGGRDGSFAALGDTWLYDLKERTWKEVESAGPDPRFGQAVAVDQKAGKLILFGGQSADVFYNDTWVFDFESEIWSTLDTGDSPLPTPRYGLPAAIDNDGKFVVSHGFTFEGRFDDTWALDLSTNQWSDISPDTGAIRPLRRCLHEMVWDKDAKRFLLYGGCSSGFGPCPQGDFWSFDPTNGEWTELTPEAGPAARSNPALVYDRGAKRTILVGGLTEAGYSSEIWSGKFVGGSYLWEAMTADGETPSPRASHDLVLARGDIYLFGGTGDSGATSDLWRLSLD